VVIDNFIDDATRLQLLHFLAGPPPATDSGPAPLGGQDHEQDASHSQQQGEAQQEEGSALPADRWERRTTDMAGGVPTWGVKQSVLQELAAGQLSALQVGAGNATWPLSWRGMPSGSQASQTHSHGTLC
jgi:hypothetical protein